MRTIQTLPRPREVTGTFGIYVHVPFCSHRCWYCDFNAYAGLEHLAGRYMAALAADAREALSAGGRLGDDRPAVTSIFVGGGTPSLVEASSLVAVLDAVRDAWPVAPDAEITVECNPESADEAKLAAYLEAGVTRLSFGVQSLDDTLLGRLGRIHDAATAVRALHRARDVGFTSLNADLIFGIPGEDDRTWRSSLEGLLACPVTHLSCYGLTYEEGTPLHAWRRLGKVAPVPDDDMARRWETACTLLDDAGFRRYEISNWALPGEESRHNGLYWACGEYLGIGAGAHSHLSGDEGSVRSWTLKPPDGYAAAVEAGRPPVAGHEEIDPDARAAEVMFLGLRRAGGVAPETFRALTGRDLEEIFGPQIDRAAAQGLVVWDARGVRLTDRGTLLANEVVSSFLSD